MTIPLITPIATVPVRGEAASNTAFRIAVDAFLTALAPFSTEFNLSLAGVNAAVADIEAYVASVLANAAAVQANTEAVQEVYGDIVATVVSGATGGSASAISIGTGLKSFAATTGKLWYQGEAIILRSAASAANFMAGQVSSYDVATGALNVNVFVTGGSGSHSDWLIYPAGPRYGVGWNEVATLPTTSGSAVTFSDLADLPWHDLMLEFIGVSQGSSGTADIRIELSDDGSNWTTAAAAFASTTISDTLYGTVELFGFRRQAGTWRAGLSNLTADRTSAATSGVIRAWRIAAGIDHIRISPSAGPFDAGSIKLLGR